METGTKISGGLHLSFLVLTVFGGSMFNSQDSVAIQVSDVSLISESAFTAMVSQAPETPQAPAEPVDVAVESEVELAPEIPAEPETVASVSPEILQPQPSQPDLAPLPDTSVPEPEPDEVAIARPKPAERIDQEAAPDTDADRGDTAEQATTPEPTAESQPEVAEEQAPEAAATQIVTEAEQTDNSHAPQSTGRPKTRPRDLAAQAQPAEDEAEQAQAAQDETAQKIADALAKAQAEAINAAVATAIAEAAASEAPASTGNPLTQGEQAGLVFAVQQCWNVPVGVADASDLVVVLAVGLKPDGSLANNPVLVSPSGAAQGAVAQAFEAARRALILCAPYDLPREKYDQWQQIEIVFNPRDMVTR